MFRLNLYFCMVLLALSSQASNQTLAQINNGVDEKSNPLAYDKGSSLGEMLEFEKNITQRLTHSPNKNLMMPHQNENKVLAIYGVGTKLITDVEFQGRQYQFKQGVSQAFQGGAITEQSAPRLINIKPPCVRLRFKRVEHHFCLEGALP